MSKLTESLRSLPSYDAPAGGWTRLEQALSPTPRRPRSRRAAAAGLALAASVLLTFGVVTRLPITSPAAADSGAVARLMQRSQGLERDLDRVRPRVVMWNADYAARARALEDRIAVVDLQLNYAQPASAERLWRDRVALLDSLVDTHRAASLSGAPARSADEQTEWSL